MRSRGSQRRLRRERIGGLRQRLAALAGDRRELGERETESLRDPIGGEPPEDPRRSAVAARIALTAPSGSDSIRDGAA